MRTDIIIASVIIITLVMIAVLATLSGPLADLALSQNMLEKGVRLRAGGEVISIRDGHLVPRAADWNQDGKKDLIVGQLSGGKVRLYLNQGTDAAPEFNGFTTLEAGGKEISLEPG